MFCIFRDNIYVRFFYRSKYFAFLYNIIQDVNFDMVSFSLEQFPFCN